MKSSTVTVSISTSDAAIIRELRKAGRYPTNAGVVHAALKQLQSAEWNPNAYPTGSLTHLYTPSQNREETLLNKVSSLRVDHDD